MFKYIKLLLAWKDITDIYKEEKGKDKSFLVSKRLIGAVFTFIGVILFLFFGVTLDENVLTSLTSNTENVIPAVITLYGVGTNIVGTVQWILRKIKEKKEAKV